MKSLIIYALLILASLVSGAQERIIKLDAKISAVQSAKKINIATVTLFDNDVRVDSIVTQNGKCIFILKENHRYKIEFSKAGYVSKYLVIETTDLPEKGKKKFKVKVEVVLFASRQGLKMDFLKLNPIGIAKYESIYKKIKWDEEYTRSIEELIIHETLHYHKEKSEEILELKNGTK
ncbi:MAG: hypothetical protein P8M05_01000 [Flavobacteriales bacterium]|jgi:hypothetical protein|nr:hypothetical protein [Crocinitomicaceae bacterium]MDG2330148.1 hypothetical protein [Flavobacteriales bacterium]